MKELFKKKTEYMKKSIFLSNIDHRNLSYQKSRLIHKEQDECYKKWLFYKNLDEAMRGK